MAGESEPIVTRWMTADEIDKLGQIDRSEVVRAGYRVVRGELVQDPVEWNVPQFTRGSHDEHSVAAQIRFCRRHLENGARMAGAFDEERLVAVGVLTPEIRPGMAQLAYLQVSSGYRRRGIATRIARMLADWAVEQGAKRIYVSATPSESAIGFYRREGYSPVREPVVELFELEPEDIHMEKVL